MRRPVRVKSRRVGGSQGACPLAEYEAAPHGARLSAPAPAGTVCCAVPTNGRRDAVWFPEGPLSLISVVFFGKSGNLSRAARGSGSVSHRLVRRAGVANP